MPNFPFTATRVSDECGGMELSEPLPFGVPIDTGVVLDLDRPNDAMPTVTMFVGGDWEDVEPVVMIPDAVVVPRVIYEKR